MLSEWLGRRIDSIGRVTCYQCVLGGLILVCQLAGTQLRAGQQPWLDEVDTGPETITWPERPAALQALDETRAKRTPPSERVTHLFPRTDTDWTVGELPLDRNRRKAAR